LSEFWRERERERERDCLCTCRGENRFDVLLGKSIAYLDSVVRGNRHRFIWMHQRGCCPKCVNVGDREPPTAVSSFQSINSGCLDRTGGLAIEYIERDVYEFLENVAMPSVLECVNLTPRHCWSPILKFQNVNVNCDAIFLFLNRDSLLSCKTSLLNTHTR